jgi:tetratricopeptide (TPR) repeat protein
LRRLALLPLTFVVLTSGGCTYCLEWWQNYRIEKAIEHHDYTWALGQLQNTLESDPDSPRALAAARLGARVAQLEAKDYALAVEFYKGIVIRSPEVDERRVAQKSVAQIYFENLQDYDQAVIEYEKLLKLEQRPAEAFHFRLNLAKSHFQLNNIDQALNEIDVLLAHSKFPAEVFEAKVLKATTLIAAKRQSEAAQLWEELLKEFPEKSQKENVALNLVVCYEDMNEFGKAIEVLERMSATDAHPEYLKLRIQRLKERKANQPGAQGLRK